LIGCALAFWLASSRPNSRPLPRGLTSAASWLGASVLLILFVGGQQANAPIQIPLAVLATATIVGGVISGRIPVRFDRFLSSRWATHVGRRSYGLYLWHFVLISGAEALMAPITGLFPSAGGPRILFATSLGLAAAAAFVVADLSYRYIELPALRLKRRFSNVGVGMAGPARAELEFRTASGAPQGPS
jgi:peptidoglycan/LPS O-acetylase OafA/YrhL